MKDSSLRDLEASPAVYVFPRPRTEKQAEGLVRQGGFPRAGPPEVENCVFRKPVSPEVIWRAETWNWELPMLRSASTWECLRGLAQCSALCQRYRKHSSCPRGACPLAACRMQVLRRKVSVRGGAAGFATREHCGLYQVTVCL